MEKFLKGHVSISFILHIMFSYWKSQNFLKKSSSKVPSIFLKTELLKRQSYIEREEKTEKSLPNTGSIPNHLQQLGPGQAEAKSQELFSVLLYGDMDSSYWAILHSFTQAHQQGTASLMEQLQLEPVPMRSQHCRWKTNQLCHNTSPAS